MGSFWVAKKKLILVGALAFLCVACSSKVVEDPRAGGHIALAGAGGNAPTGGQVAPLNPGPIVIIDQDSGFKEKLDTDVGPTEDANCGLVPFTLDRSPSPVVLLQDRSSSMCAYLPGGIYITRWASVRTAIKDVISKTEANVAWGLQFFPNATRCQVSPLPEIPSKLMNAKPVIAELDAIEGNPEGKGLTEGTPTNKALDSATKYLQSLPAGKNKYVVLATDGQPTCLNDNPNSDNFGAALESARKTAAAGIKIAVVGIAFNHEPGEPLPERAVFLNTVADLGGLPRNDPMDPDIHYYPANSTEQLTAAFHAIAAQVISCTFTLPKAPPSKNDVAVKLDGVKLPRSATEGWEYDSATTLTLSGSYCDKIKRNEGSIDIKIIMGCPGQIIP